MSVGGLKGGGGGENCDPKSRKKEEEEEDRFRMHEEGEKGSWAKLQRKAKRKRKWQKKENILILLSYYCNV